MPASKTVLLLAPYGRDADSLATILQTRGFTSEVLHAITGLAERLDDSVGAVVLTEEALAGNMTALGVALRAQEAWSDIPFVLLRASHSSSPGRRPSLPEDVLNVIELERPLSSASLLSAVSTALRARHKQFVIRDQMIRLEESQAALAASEAELRLIADSLPVLIAFVDRTLTYRFANLAYEEWFGIPVKDILGRNVETVLGPVAWEERKDAIDAVLGGQPMVLEVSWPTRDGQRRDAEIRYLPRFDQTGVVDGFHVFATDITVRKVALEATRLQAAALEARVAERTAALQEEMAARENSEAALRQAQKMEAVGQLTGGIAHDFNNMLTGVLAAMDLLRMRLAEKRFENVERFVDIAAASARRAAALTQRLLAFSRRQSLDPKPVDVNAMVRSMEDLLARTLGEGVRLETDLGERLASAMVDTNQLESALLNLAINARDAMPDGGRLSVSTGLTDHRSINTGTQVEPGTYVRMSVADTGAGMDDEVLARIFEPFYTTKPIGQGTGLGMSMIYGFIKQSNGYITVRSAPGKGTVVSLFLPAASATDVSQASLESIGTGPIAGGGGQRILVVEDDPQVRALVVELLGELGYRVDAAESADMALRLLASRPPLDLLITDVGLPGLNGRQLAEMVRQSHPGLPVLFMTGYAENATNRSEFLDAGMTMIGKPFNLDSFSQMVDRILSVP